MILLHHGTGFFLTRETPLNSRSAKNIRFPSAFSHYYLISPTSDSHLCSAMDHVPLATLQTPESTNPPSVSLIHPLHRQFPLVFMGR